MREGPQQHSPNSVRQSLLLYWTQWLFVGTAAAYLLGYFELSYFLLASGVKILPTDVFTPGSIAVSGLALALRAILVPCLALGVGWVLAQVPVVGERLYTSKGFGVIISSLVFLLLAKLFSHLLVLIEYLRVGPGNMMPAQFLGEVFPSYRMIGSTTIFALLALMIFVSGKWARSKVVKLKVVHILPAAIWFILTVIGESVQAGELAGSASHLDFSHIPGTVGRLFTRQPIWNDGLDTEFQTYLKDHLEYSAEDMVQTTPFEGAYSTPGILLSQVDGVFYFLPAVSDRGRLTQFLKTSYQYELERGTMSSSDYRDKIKRLEIAQRGWPRLLVIPSDEVISFRAHRNLGRWTGA